MSSDDAKSGRSSSSDDAKGAKERPEKSLVTQGDAEQPDAVAVRQVAASAVEVARRTDQKGTRPLTLNNTVGNELSQLIPGYTAPMRLEAKSLQGIAGASVTELRIRAARAEAATYAPPISILSKNQAAFDSAVGAKKTSFATQKRSKGGGGRIPTSFSSSFRKGPMKQHDVTAGAGWFGMAPTAMTDQLKTDLSIIRNRNYLDPKKFYKSADRFDGKVLQVGTVIEGSTEFYSSRLAKRDRRQNLTEEVMADSAVSGYAKRKYRELQAERVKPKVKRGRKRR